jgi:hypothetical protein
MDRNAVTWVLLEGQREILVVYTSSELSAGMDATS